MEKIVQTVYHSTEMLSNRQHFHDCHQIVFIVKGQAEFCINGKPLSAEAGSAVVLSRYENHSFQILSEKYERYILHLDPGITGQSSPVYSLLTDRPDGFCPVIPVSPYLREVIGIFQQLLREHGGDMQLSRELERLLVEQLLILLCRCAELKLPNTRSNIVTDLKRHLETNFWKPYTLLQLSRHYCISPSSLSHRFRAVTGTSVMEFLQACRMAHAKRLLAETNNTIDSIVESCGFSDSSNFSRTFKAQNGMTPTQFRKNHRIG